MHKLLFAAGSRVSLAPTSFRATVSSRYRVTVLYDRAIKRKREPSLSSPREMNQPLRPSSPPLSPSIRDRVGLRYIKFGFEGGTSTCPQFPLKERDKFGESRESHGREPERLGRIYEVAIDTSFASPMGLRLRQCARGRTETCRFVGRRGTT